MQQLVGAEAEDLDDLGIQPVEGALRELRDQVIEGGPPSLHAGGDLRGEGAVAVVVQAAARAAIAVGRSARPDDTADRIS